MITPFFDLMGKTALVTGASSGLGEQFAKSLANAGAKVVVTARRKELLEKVAAEIASKGGQAIPLVLDIHHEDAIQNTFQVLEERGEKIDVLVNNAGIAKVTSLFDEAKSSDFETIFQTNVMGLWNMTQKTAQHMKHHKIEGSIINIASVNGANRLCEGIAVYSASKAAVIQMTKALVGELARHKIRINCILPGLFETNLTSYQFQDPKDREYFEKIIPLGYIGKPEDLEGALLFLASHQTSRYVTGISLVVDGGISWGGSYFDEHR